MSTIRTGNEGDGPFIIRQSRELYAALESMPASLREAFLFAPLEYDTVGLWNEVRFPQGNRKSIPPQELVRLFAKGLLGPCTERRVERSTFPPRGADRYPINPPRHATLGRAHRT